VLGFTAVFTLLGAGAGLMGLAISEHIVLIRKIAGILMILMGVFLLLALKVPRLNFERRINAGSNQKTGYLRSFITGGVFALGWTPCVGPILGGILALAVGTGTAVKGAYLLIIYSLGLGLPFLIIGIAFDALRRQLTRIQRYSVIIYVVSGLLMIVVGVLVLTDKLALLSISV
jgi:cytochrome c-type biogenesis protein